MQEYQSVKRTRKPAPKPSSRRKVMKNLTQGGKMDKTLLSLLGVLLVVGLITLFSASMPAGLSTSAQDPLLYIRQQLIYAVIGVPLVFLLSKIQARTWRKFVAPAFVVSIIFMILALFVKGEGDANRWLDFRMLFGTSFNFRFQPSEIAKLALILAMASILAAKKDKLNSFKKGFLPLVLVLGIIAGLMTLQRHLSGLILVLGIGLILMSMGGVPIRYLVLLVTAGGVAMYLLVMFVPKFNGYVLPRIDTWLHLEDATPDDAYQVTQSLIAVGSGGIGGRGLGQSVQKHMYLPAMANDFIFAVFCEEFGLIGAIILVGLFVALFIRGIMLAGRIKDRFSSLIMVGISVQIALQALLHIAVNTAAFPCTGISLPFFSMGGTSLVILMLEAGLMLSVSRQADGQAVTTSGTSTDFPSTAKEPFRRKGQYAQ